MNLISDTQITNYVRQNISKYHDARVESIKSQSLEKLLKRKNPYLYKSKDLVTSYALVKAILDAHLASQEETLFGDFLEALAIYIAEITLGGWKSTAKGIDLEFRFSGARYLVSIKSGPNWGNSNQISKLKDNFRDASKLIRQNDRTAQVIAVNGCCYGHDSRPDKGVYQKICGQAFWEFITGDPEFFLRIIEPLGYDAKRQNARFSKSYDLAVNQFADEFSNKFCDANGHIDWENLVRFNSSSSAIIS